MCTVSYYNVYGVYYVQYIQYIGELQRPAFPGRVLTLVAEL
jgi:hypothetical protein